MYKVVSAEAAVKNDKNAIASGISSHLLMKRAAEGMYGVMGRLSLIFGRTAIICGSGNNGGDGFCLAEIMRQKGNAPDVFYFESKTEDSKYYSAKFCGKKNIITNAPDLSNYDIVIDCLFGTGLNREVSGLFKDCINAINKSGAVVISCDIPSGVCGTSGKVFGVAVKSYLTITFGSENYGHLLGDGRDFYEHIEVVDIGIETGDDYAEVTEIADLKEAFMPLLLNIHKGDSGKVGIIGGSKNFVGAPLLTASGTAALRTGAGLNYLGFPDFLYDAFAARAVNNILFPLPTEKGVITFDENAFEPFIKMDAVALGMGAGKCDCIDKIITLLIKNKTIKLVLDADGINNVKIETLKNCAGNILITPHPKEFARLSGIPLSDVLQNPVSIAKAFAAENGIIVLLKGAVSIITDGARTVLNTFGTPAQAKGGSGDLLSGVIAGLAARGLDLFTAAYIGSGICGLAAELAVRDNNEFSVLPSDTADYITQAINNIVKNRLIDIFADGLS